MGAAFLQVVPRDGLAVAADVSVVVMAVAVLILAFVAMSLMLRVGRAIRDIRMEARRSMGPVSDRARAISDNVEFITQALRTDVERLNASVKALTDRLQLASERMEERIEEFNALMEVMQDEAEGIFIDTASTVRGVRAGARSIASAARDPAAGRQGGEAFAGGAADDEAQALAAEEA
jgi:hypothetical protein